MYIVYGPYPTRFVFGEIEGEGSRQGTKLRSKAGGEATRLPNITSRANYYANNSYVKQYIKTQT